MIHADQLARARAVTLAEAAHIFRNLSARSLIFAWNGADAGPTNGIILHPEGVGSGGVMHLEAGFTSIPVPQFTTFSVRGSQGGQAFTVEVD